MRKKIIITVVLIVLAGTVFLIGEKRVAYAPAEPQSDSTATARVRTSEIKDIAKPFSFSFEIPKEWQAEAVPQIEAINIYNPIGAGQTNLEKSQIFIRYFKANSFLTLSTVNILSRTEKTIIDRPAVDYIIEKKSGVANFDSQPFWRNLRHRVVDIRVSDNNPSIFHVFAQRPELADEQFERFLNSLQYAQKYNFDWPLRGQSLLGN